MDSDDCKEKNLDHLAKSSDEGKRNRNDAGDIAKAAKKQKKETNTSNEFGTPEEQGGEEEESGEEESGEEEGEEEESEEEESEEEELEPNTSKPQQVLLLRHTHTDTSNCRHSIKKFLQDMVEIEAVEIPDELDQPIEAVVVGKLDAEAVRERFNATEYDVIVTEKSVDCEDDKKATLQEKEFTAYIKNFNSRVEESVSGTIGKMYKNSYKGVVSIRIIYDEKDSTCTGFVVYLSGECSIILTTAHGFEPTKKYTVEVTNSSFKQFPAKVWLLPNELDFCLLKVENELFGKDVVELPTSIKRVNFGEKITSIGCPSYWMCDESEVGPDIRKLVNILWFVLSVGRVSHPFVVGAITGSGVYLKLCGGDFGSGASGSPILNGSGEVVGLYTNITVEEETSDIAHWGLTIESVVENIVQSLLGVYKGLAGLDIEKEEKALRAASLKKLVADRWDY